jgi:hypothetical protein
VACFHRHFCIRSSRGWRPRSSKFGFGLEPHEKRRHLFFHKFLLPSEAKHLPKPGGGLLTAQEPPFRNRKDAP